MTMDGIAPVLDACAILNVRFSTLTIHRNIIAKQQAL